MIGSSKPIIQQSTQDVEPEIKQEPIHTVVMTHSDVDLTKLNKYIDGSSWSVDYYSIATAENDMNMPLDRDGITALQQYEKILNLELKVTQPIEPANYESVEGEATLAANVIAKEGDMFVSPLDSGRIGLFRVISVTHELYNLNKIFKITYKLDGFVDKNSEEYLSLERKVIREFVYDKEYAVTDSNPILTKEDYIVKIDLEQTLDEIQRYFINTFYDNSTRTLLVPELVKTIDPYHEFFIFQTFSYRDNMLMDELNRFPIDKTDFLFGTIYDVILNKNKNAFRFIKDVFSMENRLMYNEIPILKTGRYYNISFIVSRSQNNSESSITGDNVLALLKESNYGDNLIPNRHIEKHWFFSEKFYSENLPTTIIEELVLQYLDNEHLNTDKLLRLIESFRNWSLLDQFYYIPFLVVLIRYRVTGTYSLGVSV